MTRSFLQLFVLALGLAVLLFVAAAIALPWFGYQLSVRPKAGTEARSVMNLGTSGDEPATLAQPAAPQAAPTNLVILLADGLGFPQLVAARATLAGARGKLTFERFPITAWHTTFNLDNTYTDSGAGATALAAGVETPPGRLAVDADGHRVETLMERAMAQGKSVAVITDSYLWDASPSAFLVHQEDRREYDDIARQVAASGVALAFGEARSRDEASIEPRLEPFRQAGFRVVRSGSELELAAAVESGTQVIGLFEPGDVADPDVAPELSDLARLALRRLAADPDGFVLFVESEEIDSGSHNGDLDRVVDGLGALDEVARHVVDFARDRDDTLVVFTGDHETGGLALAHSDDGEPLRAMWAWGHHTWAPVPLLAWGPGSEQLLGVRSTAEVGQILRRLILAAPDAAPEDRPDAGPDGQPAGEPEPAEPTT